MKLPNWGNWKNRKSQKQKILSQIEETIRQTERAGRAADRLVAALDGESGWFVCECRQKNTRNENGTINSTPGHKRCA